MAEATTTLANREEKTGRTYPLWVERLILIAAIVIFATQAGRVHETVGGGAMGALAAFVLFPLVLLAAVEMVGRMLQRSLNSSL